MKLLGLACLLALSLGASCKPKAPPFEGTCFVPEIVAESSQPVRVVVAFPTKSAGYARPTGTFLLRVSEVGASSKQRCELQAKVSPESYGPDAASALTLASAEPCAGAEPASGHVEVHTFFAPDVPDAHDKLAECGSSVVVPTVWNSRRAEPEPAPSANAPFDPRPVVRVDIKDALRFPNGKIDEAPKPIRIYARVPGAWLIAGSLTPKAKTALLAKLYGGPNWEKGNGDGSLYVVRSFESRQLTPAEIAQPVWSPPSSNISTWFYETKPDGSLDKRGPSFGPPLEPSPPVHLNEL